MEIKKIYDFDYIVDEVIRKEARDEAKLILRTASDEQMDEFIQYYKAKSFNICCMHLDTIKYKLVKDGKMIQNVNDCFGDIEWMFEN